MERLQNLLALMRGELWIIPAVMAGSALWLAVAIIGMPSPPDFEASGVWWLASGDVETARQLLSAFLSGLLTMISIVVSLTFVVLSLAANQLGPRIIWQFMSDRQIQFVLGLFVGTILYVLVTLSSLDETSSHPPDLSLSVASLSVATCIAALLFFVNKIARAIIADNVLEAISGRLSKAIDRLPDAGADEEADAAVARAALEADGASMALGQPGYVQTVKYGALMAAAAEADVCIALLVQPGDHVLHGGMHARLPGAKQIPKPLADAIRDAVIIGRQRSPAQDPAFLMGQIVEVAVRALSPGINDPFTAVAAIDELAVLFEQLRQKRLGPRVERDPKGDVRCVGAGTGFDGLLQTAFDPIRRAGADHVEVLERLARAARALAPGGDVGGSVQAFLNRLEATVDQAAFTAEDEARVREEIAAAWRALRSA